MKQPCVYIIASGRNGTLYTGVTSNLLQRVSQHRQGAGSEFTSEYACKLLVFYETHDSMEAAIMREKQFKAGSRKKKLSLIETANPNWDDLFESLM